MTGQSYDSYSNMKLMLIIYEILTSLLVLNSSFRWGNETSGRHGGFLSGPDNYSPGHVIPHKWERCTKLDKQLSWAYRKNIELTDIMSTQVITYSYTPSNSSEKYYVRAL